MFRGSPVPEAFPGRKFSVFPRRFDEKCIISESVFSDDSTSEGSCSQGVFNNERHSTILHTAVVQLIGFAVSAVIGVIDLLIKLRLQSILKRMDY